MLGETDPLASWAQLEPVSSELVMVECLRTIERYRSLNAIDATEAAERRIAVLEILGAFGLVGLSRPILERAGDPFPLAVATLDAIHLASALRLREEFAELAFATHDAQLGAAARAMGFAVIGL